MKKIIKELISSIYPNKCIGCGEIISEEKFLCDVCNKNIEYNDMTNFCTSCGFEKCDCVCKYNVYRFDKIVSVFKNTGIAQSAYYKYKFGKKQHYAKFFADKMSLVVKKMYDDINFDLICSVPSSKRVFGYTQYEHCRYIAEYMSKSLKIPYINDVLFCCKRSKLQHKSTISQRLTNVDEKYDFGYEISGKSVLLIDDIRTTGATLDECAKTLLYAGADSVYCVTALAIKIKSKSELKK